MLDLANVWAICYLRINLGIEREYDMKKRDIQLKLNALEIRVQALESIDYIKRLDNLEQMVNLKKENKKLREKVNELKALLKEQK